MREQFEIGLKIQFSQFLGDFWDERSKFVIKKSKGRALACQGQTGEIPPLDPRKLDIFLVLALIFPPVPPKKIGHAHLFQSSFSK